MEKISINFNKNKPFQDYLTDNFLYRNIGAAVTHRQEGDMEKTTITVECERDVFEDVLSEAMTVAYKCDIIKQCVEGRGVAYAAFCGELVGQDFAEYKKTIKEALPKSGDVNTDGIFNFLLTDVDLEWRAWADIGGKLFANCKDKEDLYALIGYFLGGEPLMPRTLIVGTTIYFDDDNTDIPCYAAFDDPSECVAFNVLLKRPSEVIIASPGQYSPDLIELIKKLGG